jgi:hypothetical protein
MEEKRQGSSGLGLGLDVDLRLGELQSTVDQLTGALQSAGDKLAGNVGSLVQKIREQAQQLQQAAQKEGGQGQAAGLLQRVIALLQEAANRGEDQARKLLAELGQKAESAGQKMQETARPR